MAHIDVRLATAALHLAIEELQGRADGDVILRPSTIGWCPARLWDVYHDPVALAEERDGRRQWMAMQGDWNEPLLRMLLRQAGAQVLDPPKDEGSEQQPSEVTGFVPHTDGVILWPEAGITEWSWLELKDLRTQAVIELISGGLEADRAYWYQTVAYLMDAETTFNNYASVDTYWDTLKRLGVMPTGTLFVACAKDPSTTKMMLGQQVKAPKYELEPPTGVYERGPKKGQPKTLTPEQEAMILKRQALRLRLEENGEQSDWYMEYFHRDEPRVQNAWLDILETIPLIKQSQARPIPIHDPTLPDDQLHVECAVYCSVLDRCREFMQQDQWRRSIDLLSSQDLSPEERSREDDLFRNFDPSPEREP